MNETIDNEDEFDEMTKQDTRSTINGGLTTRANVFADDEETARARSSLPREVELEAKLKAETDRREAAEAKLVGVQAKFEEAKADLEKETADMRARLMKTLEDRAKQGAVQLSDDAASGSRQPQSGHCGERKGPVVRPSS